MSGRGGSIVTPSPRLPIVDFGDQELLIASLADSTPIHPACTLLQQHLSFLLSFLIFLLTPFLSCVFWSRSIVYSICNESTDLSVADCAGVYVVQFGESASQLIHPIADVRPGRTQAAAQQPSYGVLGGFESPSLSWMEFVICGSMSR